MAYDPGLAEILRSDLADRSGISEKKMFGGLCFLLDGNMLCGLHKDGGMFRVGKDHEAAAMAIPGASEMDFTGRPMRGFVNVTDEALADDERRQQWLTLALRFVGALDPK